MSKFYDGTIYQAINIINGKSYIGQTTQDFESYKQYHIDAALKGNNKQFYIAIRKYGPENFVWRILYQKKCTREHLCYAEKFFIAYYETYVKNGYNLSAGGEFGDTMSNHPNKKEIFRKRSEKMNKIDPITGLTIYDKIGKKVSKIKKEINLETGLTNAKLAGRKISKTVNMIDSETGLTKAKLIGLKISKTMKERGTTKGKNNPWSRNLKIIDPNGKVYIICGNLRSFCKEHKLSYMILHRNKNKIVKICTKNFKHPKFINRYNTIGWMIQEV